VEFTQKGRAANGGYRLAVADPSDTAAILAPRKSWFGSAVEVAVALVRGHHDVLDQARRCR